MPNPASNLIPRRAIAASGKTIPELGMGTWKSFDVPTGMARNPLPAILRAFSAAGGSVIDTSPCMAGRKRPWANCCAAGKARRRLRHTGHGENPGHMAENLAYTTGCLPTREQRAEWARLLENL